MTHEDTYRQQLCELLAQVDDPAAMEKLLIDLLTPAELQAICGRWEVAKLLSGKQHSYREIYELTKVSTATVTRVARSMTQGTGGYELALKLVGEQDDGESPVSVRS